MELLAAQLAGRVLGGAVVDRTGVAGGFDVNLEWTPDESQDLAEIRANQMTHSDWGTPGVFGLMRFWRQYARRTDCENRQPPNSEDLRGDALLLAGLRLGIRETLDFLTITAPSFEQFEEWVLAKNGGNIGPERIQRLNSALRRDGSFELESILDEPVLSEDDLARWDEQGYVVVKNAVGATACSAAIDAIFSSAGMSRDEPESWYQKNIRIPLAHHPALWENRNSPRIHTGSLRSGSAAICG